VVVGCILAGGVGTRVGAPVPKQFYEVLGKPIIVYTMERLDECPDVDVFDVVCVCEYIDSVYDYAKKYNIRKLRKVVAGGDSFGESVRNGVYALKGYCSPTDIFFIHMSTSPLVSEEIISDLVSVCKKNGNAFSAEPSYMCMCEKTGESFSDKFLDRDVIFGLNTPQAVQYGKVLELYERAEREGYDLFSRPHLSTLMFDMGERLFFSKSSSMNIKVTTMDDIRLLKAYLSMNNQNTEVDTNAN